jgi:hypothetical protein
MREVRFETLFRESDDFLNLERIAEFRKQRIFLNEQMPPRARRRNRTGNLFITSEVLCQLS